MTAKKPEQKRVARARPSLVSASLEGTVRGKATAAAEPWRNRQGKANTQGQSGR